MTDVEVVLDAGPIPYRQIALYGDPDLEHGLRHAGFEPQTSSYRLVEIPLASIDYIRSGLHEEHMSRAYIDKAAAGVDFPLIVVMPTLSGWALLDGVNRTHAYWVLGWRTVRAYDLIVEDASPRRAQEPCVGGSRTLRAIWCRRPRASQPG